MSINTNNATDTLTPTSGTATTAGLFRVSSAVDSTNIVTLTGASYGLRLGTVAATGASVQAVDTTGSASYQPLYLTGTTILLAVSGGANGLQIEANGNSYPSGTASTSMTNGFFYIPAAAGAPSGTPTSISGHVPMYYDSTNNNFYVYNGAWKKVLLV